jgi:integrase
VTVFKHPRGKTWRYDFRFRGKRYIGNTQQLTKDEAQLAEREIELRLRHQASGIAQFFPQQTPRFDDWCKIFVAYKRKRLERADHPATVARVLMRFWGHEPPAKEHELAPQHDLRLGDPIADPSWLLKFEDWMSTRGIGHQSKNHYRGVLRRMYALAMQPEFRKVTGITTNPVVGLANDPTSERTVALTKDQVRDWLAAATYHVRLAIAIGALAPKLRLRNVLALEWAEHFEPDPRTIRFDPKIPHYIVVRQHKTARATRRPLVSPVTTQLLTILKDAWKRSPQSIRVVSYRGAPVKSIRDGAKAAAEKAGIPYGRDTPNGATFHTLRHTAATLLSLAERDPLKLRDAMGHTDLATTLRYRHLRPEHERASLERLGARLPIADLIVTPAKRRRRRKNH